MITQLRILEGAEDFRPSYTSDKLHLLYTCWDGTFLFINMRHFHIYPKYTQKNIFPHKKWNHIWNSFLEYLKNIEEFNKP